MRRIIDGTAYDTETGELIKEFLRDEDGEQATTLYRNRHGEFFFCNRFLVPYFDAESLQQQYYPKEELTPCTHELAQKWLEDHANNLVEQYFGEMPEAGAAERRLTLRMPNNLARRLETKAGETPLTRYINRCLERCVAEDEKTTTVVPDPTEPEVSGKIMERSRQRAGVVAGGALLSSGAKQATVAFPPGTILKLKLAAEKKGVALSEMVRQCVDVALDGSV